MLVHFYVRRFKQNWPNGSKWSIIISIIISIIVFKLVGIVQLLQFTGLEWRKKGGQEVDRKRCALGLNVSSESHRYSANSAHVFYLTSHPSQPCCGWRSSTQALVHASILLTTASSVSLEGSKKTAVFPSMVCFVSPEGSDTRAQVGPNQDSHWIFICSVLIKLNISRS